MAYNFITTADLKASMIDKFINERSQEDPYEILEAIEQRKIALVKGKLSGMYDLEAIFTATGDDRNYLIVEIITKLMLYDFIRRNAARKVPEDYVEDWKWAIKQLDMLASGDLVPEDLPLSQNLIDQEGSSFHGNNYNTDWNI